MEYDNTFISGNTAELLLGVKKAANEIADIVAKTSGPQGHNCMLITDRNCHVTKDGISVLRSIVQPRTVEEKIALSILRSASEQTNKEAGDATTATCIVANEIFQQGYGYLTAGYNGNVLRNGILKAEKIAEEILKTRLSTPVKTSADIYNVAKISSNGSDEIAKVISDVFEKIGTDGTARVELSNTTETFSKVVFGMSFDKGYMSPYFATNEHGEAVLDNPIVLVVNKKLNVVGELVKPMEALMRQNRPILIVADGYEQDILNTLVLNKLRGVPVCAVSAPSYGKWKTDMMEDIAVVTDALVISPETGNGIEDILTNPNICGTAKQVIVGSETTSIMASVSLDPAQNPRLATRIAEIDSQLNDPGVIEGEKIVLRTRKARLVSGVGVISVGGCTEAEMHEKKDLVDDAFSSVKSALKDGIVPGSGVTLLCLRDAIYQYISDNLDSLTDAETVAFKVFAEALAKPFLAVMDNSGKVNSQFALSMVQERNWHNEDQKVWTLGYDLSSEDDQIIDVMKAGIVDSAAAIISAIRNGAASGSQLLTVAGVVSTQVKTRDASPQPMM